MRNKFFTQLAGGIMLSALALTFSSCEDDHESTYYRYGLVNKSEDNKFSITLDNGYLINPLESSINTSRLNDSSRVIIGFNILSEQDSTVDVRLFYTDTILTKPVLAYDESMLDSIGNDPIKITQAWFAHGFLNLEFIYSGRYNISSETRHMVNLLQHPSEDGKLVFDFRHNDFDDRIEKVYKGAASFPIAKILADMEKPLTITVKYKDSSASERSIDLTYK